jgi:hypothetical protein
VIATLAKLFGWAVKPPGIYLTAALAVALAIWASGQLGYHRGDDACETAHKVAMAAEVQRQERAATAAVAASEARTAADVKTDTQNQEAIRYVVKTVYARPDAGVECIPAAVADRLRSLQ